MKYLVLLLNLDNTRTYDDNYWNESNKFLTKNDFLKECYVGYKHWLLDTSLSKEQHYELELKFLHYYQERDEKQESVMLNILDSYLKRTTRNLVKDEQISTDKSKKFFRCKTSEEL